ERVVRAHYAASWERVSKFPGSQTTHRCRTTDHAHLNRAAFNFVFQISLLYFMLIVKSKYRIAKRLGAGVFDQTQTQKFALAEANTQKKRGRGQSDYGRQLLEKQRVRFTYGLSERQLSNYAKEAYLAKDPSVTLHKML